MANGCVVMAARSFLTGAICRLGSVGPEEPAEAADPDEWVEGIAQSLWCLMSGTSLGWFRVPLWARMPTPNGGFRYVGLTCCSVYSFRFHNLANTSSIFLNSGGPRYRLKRGSRVGW